VPELVEGPGKAAKTNHQLIFQLELIFSLQPADLQ
jgi:hypothetical protein